MNNRASLRLIVLRVLVVSLLATLLGRLYDIQVIDGKKYRTVAHDNQIRDVITQPPRGEIVDDEGRPLIDNKIALVVKVNRLGLLEESETGAYVLTPKGRVVLGRLSRVLHVSVNLLREDLRLCSPKVSQPCWAGSPYEPIPVSQLKPGLSSTMKALRILETNDRFPGVTVHQEAVRNYPEPYGALASAELGYIEPITPSELKKLPSLEQAADIGSEVGASGLEAEYEKYLHGRIGIKQLDVDAAGNPTRQVSYTPPEPGDTLVTNLDAHVQADLEKELQSRIASQRSQGFSATFAAGVVLNVKTGGVVAMASEPTYQPDIFDQGVSLAQYKKLEHEEGAPLFDKAFQSAEPPGSTFKLISSSGLLWDHTYTPGQYVDCSSLFQDRHNFEGEAGGEETMHTAIVQSCDTFFYRLAANDWYKDQLLIGKGKKPIEGVQHLARLYGMGTAPDIDLPGATEGHIGDRLNQRLDYGPGSYFHQQACIGAKRPHNPNRDTDAYDCAEGGIWHQGDQENEDTGQGTVTVSPLQLAVAYAAIADGGKVLEPRVAKAIISPQGKVVKRFKPVVRDHLPLSAAQRQYILDALYDVPRDGTAAGVYAGWDFGKVNVGGKTGTAEIPLRPHSKNQSDGWFASFAGHAGQSPQYVTVIEVYKADQGANSAAPASRVMWDDIFGMDGHKPVWPDGDAPTALPVLGSKNSRTGSTTGHRSHA